MSHYYSTSSFLEYIINHYFYDGIHFIYAADNFYPYGQSNPKSSNPLLIYTDMYQPWKDKDEFDKYLTQHRMGLRKGVIAKDNEGVIDPNTSTSLKNICENIDIEFLYPIVYRIEIEKVEGSRKKKAGSGKKGSDELLIEDLKDSEFDMLFLDYSDDKDINSLKNGKIGNASHAMPILLRRAT